MKPVSAAPEPSLVAKMRALADEGHPLAERLREKASAFESAAREFQEGADRDAPLAEVADTNYGAALILTWQNARMAWAEANKPEPGSVENHR